MEVANIWTNFVGTEEKQHSSWQKSFFFSFQICEKKTLDLKRKIQIFVKLAWEILKRYQLHKSVVSYHKNFDKCIIETFQ